MLYYLVCHSNLLWDLSFSTLPLITSIIYPDFPIVFSLLMTTKTYCNKIPS